MSKKKIYLACGIILGTIVVSSISTFIALEFAVKKEVKILANATTANVNEEIVLEASTRGFSASHEMDYQWFANDQLLDQNTKTITITSTLAQQITYKLIAKDKKNNKEYSSTIAIDFVNK